MSKKVSSKAKAEAAKAAKAKEKKRLREAEKRLEKKREMIYAREHKYAGNKEELVAHFRKELEYCELALYQAAMVLDECRKLWTPSCGYVQYYELVTQTGQAVEDLENFRKLVEEGDTTFGMYTSLHLYLYQALAAVVNSAQLYDALVKAGSAETNTAEGT